MIKEINFASFEGERFFKIEIVDEETFLSHVYEGLHTTQCHECGKKRMCDKIHESLNGTDNITYDGYFCVDISNEQKNKIRWLFKN